MILVRARNLVVLATGVVLAASLVVSSAQAVVRTGNPPRTGTAVGVATIAGGTVTDAGGAATPGASVKLYAWPSDAVLRTMKPGQLVPTTLMATATTSATGKYILRVPESKLQVAARVSGYANLEIRSAVGESWFLSHPTSKLSARSSTPVTVNLGGNSGPSCGSDAQHHPYSLTGYTLLSQRKPALAIIGQGYIVQQKQTAGDFMQFKFGPGQISSLGVGISGYGIDAGYVSTGTTTSTVGPADYPNETKSTLFRTAFSVGQFRAECFSADSRTPQLKQHGKCPRTFKNHGAVFYVHKCLWLVKSTGWFGGMSIVHPKSVPATPAKFCTPKKANSVFKTGNEKSLQWPTGFEIGDANSIKGADLKTNFNTSAQVGYDANAAMEFHFKHTGFACGTTTAAAQSPIVVIRGTKP